MYRGLGLPPTTTNSAPASASMTNNFSNDGSIIGRRYPGFLADHPRVAAQHFQSLQWRQFGQVAAHSPFQRFLEVINHGAHAGRGSNRQQVQTGRQPRTSFGCQIRLSRLRRPTFSSCLVNTRGLPGVGEPVSGEENRLGGRVSQPRHGRNPSGRKVAGEAGQCGSLNQQGEPDPEPVTRGKDLGRHFSRKSPKLRSGYRPRRIVNDYGRIFFLTILPHDESVDSLKCGGTGTRSVFDDERDLCAWRALAGAHDLRCRRSVVLTGGICQQNHQYKCQVPEPRQPPLPARRRR